MSLRIDPEFQSFIPELSEAERKGLERSILEEGVRDPLVVWGDTILDGHNRYEIAAGENQDGLILDFQMVYMDFPGREEAKEWIAENQLNRRNLTGEWISYLRGEKYKAAKKSHGGTGANQHNAKEQSDQNDHSADPEPSGDTAENMAEKNGVSPATIRRDAEYAGAVDKLADEFGVEFRHKLLEGQSKLTKTDTFALAKAVDEQPEVTRVTGELLINEAAADLNIAYLQARTLFECGKQTWDALFEHGEEAKVRHAASQLKHLLSLAKAGNGDDVTSDLVEIVETGQPITDPKTGKERTATSVQDAHKLRQKEREEAGQEKSSEAEEAARKWGALINRANELASSIRTAGGAARIARHWPEQNRRIVGGNARDLGEQFLQFANELERGGESNEQD